MMGTPRNVISADRTKRCRAIAPEQRRRIAAPAQEFATTPPRSEFLLTGRLVVRDCSLVTTASSDMSISSGGRPFDKMQYGFAPENPSSFFGVAWRVRYSIGKGGKTARIFWRKPVL